MCDQRDSEISAPFYRHHYGFSKDFPNFVNIQESKKYKVWGKDGLIVFNESRRTHSREPWSLLVRILFGEDLQFDFQPNAPFAASQYLAPFPAFTLCVSYRNRNKHKLKKYFHTCLLAMSSAMLSYTVCIAFKTMTMTMLLWNIGLQFSHTSFLDTSLHTESTLKQPVSLKFQSGLKANRLIIHMLLLNTF